MTTRRLWLVIGAVFSVAVFAYLGRDAVHDLVVLPVAYLLWQLRGLLSGVAQLVQWGILVVVTALVMAWQLVPRLVAPGRRPTSHALRSGPVNVTADSLWRARSSNYFRWQLAHRLGRAVSMLPTSPAADPLAGKLDAAIAAYLDAGVNHSFVEFSTPHLPFARRAGSPLDVSADEVVQYLERHVMRVRDPYADGA